MHSVAQSRELLRNPCTAAHLASPVVLSSFVSVKSDISTPFRNNEGKTKPVVASLDQVQDRHDPARRSRRLERVQVQSYDAGSQGDGRTRRHDARPRSSGLWSAWPRVRA